jgi:hypothetical protein
MHIFLVLGYLFVASKLNKTFLSFFTCLTKENVLQESNLCVLSLKDLLPIKISLLGQRICNCNCVFVHVYGLMCIHEKERMFWPLAFYYSLLNLFCYLNILNF